MKVSILVPLRAERGPVGDERLRNWAWLEARWRNHFPEFEIVIGVDDGRAPFSKTQAVNDAYSRSTGDMLVLADADSWVDAPSLVRGLHYAQTLGVLVVPWTTAHRLSAADSARLLASSPTAPSPVTKKMVAGAEPYRPSPSTVAMIAVLTRDCFERVGGMDPRFRGWGAEDVAFGLACGTLLGRSHITPGEAYALHHERPRTNGLRVWEDDPGHHNIALADRYWGAKGKHGAMTALCLEHLLTGSRTPIGVGPHAHERPVPEYVPEFQEELQPEVLVREFAGYGVRDGDRIQL